MYIFNIDDEVHPTNSSFVIPPGVSNVCIQLLAVDDDIVEGEEVLIGEVVATNLRDSVNGNVSIVIIDNDGTQSLLNYTLLFICCSNIMQV